MSSTTIHEVKTFPGIAGQYVIRAMIEHPGEGVSVAWFTGSTYGGPVLAEFGNVGQVFVSDPGRFGEFGETWVRRFFGEAA